MTYMDVDPFLEKPIKKGRELFIDYGEKYWGGQ